MSLVNELQDRARAGGIHLGASVLVAAGVAALVFVLWYPGAYRYMAGGVELLILIVVVDVVLGPLLTFVVYDRSKGVRHLRRDIVTIAALQLAALFYGLHTVYLARPVALAFEFDRFRILAMADVVVEELPQAPATLRQLPWDGPTLLAVRRGDTKEERAEALNAAIFMGIDNSQRPRFWIPYDQAERGKAVAAGRPLERLIDRYPIAEADALRLVESQDRQTNLADFRFLPVRAKNDAVVVLSPEGEIIGFLQYDGFF